MLVVPDYLVGSCCDLSKSVWLSNFEHILNSKLACVKYNDTKYVKRCYHSSSGFCGGGTGGKLSLSSSSLSFCANVSFFLSIIFWVKSTRNRPSVSSSDVLRDKLITMLIHTRFYQEGAVHTNLGSPLLSSARKVWPFPLTCVCSTKRKIRNKESKVLVTLV